MLPNRALEIQRGEGIGEDSRSLDLEEGDEWSYCGVEIEDERCDPFCLLVKSVCKRLISPFFSDTYPPESALKNLFQQRKPRTKRPRSQLISAKQ